MKPMKGILLSVVLALVASCGSSGGSEGTGTSEPLAPINTIGDIPTSVLDPSQYDVSTNTALQASASPAKLFKPESQDTVFSRAGCETDRMKRNIIRNALLPKMILCFVQAFEGAAEGNAAGTNEFNFWNASAEMGDEGEGPPGVDSFSPRMAIKKSGDDLTFVMCNGTDKVMELLISTANNEYSGHVIDMWGDGFHGEMDFLADGPPEDFTTASFTQRMVEESSYWSGFGSETLEATPLFNTVYGFYNEQGENNYAGAVYAQFDATQGTARYKQDSEGSYPAWTIQRTYDNCVMMNPSECGDIDIDWLGAEGWLAVHCGLPDTLTAEDHICYSDDSEECVTGDGPCCPSAAEEGAICTSPAGLDTQESFAITLADAVNHTLEFSVAATSDYADAVAAATLPESGTAPVIEFTSASADVDCSASDSWTPLEFVSEPDVTECEAMEEELNDWDTGELCQILDSAESGTAGVD